MKMSLNQGAAFDFPINCGLNLWDCTRCYIRLPEMTFHLVQFEELLVTFYQTLLYDNIKEI